MFFQSLAGLWFALSLPAIVVMYLLKRKYIDTPIPSGLLWHRVLREMEANRPWQKLRNNLLLLLQLLAAALLVLAIMQPYIWTKSGTKGHLVIVLDRSASMDARMPASTGAAAESRLDAAKRSATELIRGDGLGSRITLLAMGEQPDVLLSREADAAKAAAAVAAVTPVYGRAAYAETMSLAAALTRDDPDAEIRVFTDGQWTETAAGLSFAVPVRLERISGSGDNVGIVQFGVKPPAKQADLGPTAASGDAGNNAVAVVKNWGESLQETDLSLYAGGKLETVRHETLKAGEQKTLYFDKLPATDYYKIKVDTSDVLAADNQAFAFAGGEGKKKALLVSAGNLFLEKALVLAGVEVTKVQAAGENLPPLPRGESDFVVLDGVAAETLKTAEWRDLLRRKPVWTLNAGDGKEIDVPAGDYTLTDHPVARYLHLDDTHIAKMRETAIPAWGKPVLSAGGKPLIYAGLDQGLPQLRFMFDLHQSDLPLRTEFPILVQNAADWLGSRQTASLGRAVAGEKKEIPVSPKSVSARWVPLDVPAEAGGGAASVAAEKREGAVSATQTVPARPGLYQFEETESSEVPTSKSFIEVIADPRETNLSLRPDLTFAVQPQAGGPSDNGNAAVQSGGAAAADAASAENRSPYGLIRWLALAVLILTFAEWGVYRRGSAV